MKIAKKCRPFTEGEFIKECITDAVNIMSPKKVKKYSSIPLSRNTVSSRINDLAEDSERQLKSLCNDFVSFSLATDESTDVCGTAQES